MLGEIVVYKTKEKRNVTVKEIAELIEEKGLIINYYNERSTEQGNAWIDIIPPFDNNYELRSLGEEDE